MSRKRVLSNRYSANSIEYQFYKYFKDVEAQFPLGPYKYDFFFPKFNLLLDYYWSSMEVYMKSIGI